VCRHDHPGEIRQSALRLGHRRTADLAGDHHQHRRLQKLFSPDLRLGFLAHANDLAAKLAAGLLPPDKAAQASQLIFNDRLDALLAAIFMLISWVMVFETIRIVARVLRGRSCPPLTESAHMPSRLVEDWVRD